MKPATSPSTTPSSFRKRPVGLAAALGAMLALANAPAQADLFKDEFITPSELVTLPAGIGQQCHNVIVSRDSNDTVLDIPDILPITVEVWGLNMERLQTVTPSSGPIRADVGTIRTAATNRDGVGNRGRGCQFRDSAEVEFRAQNPLTVATTQNFVFTKSLEVGQENFTLPVRFHPILPTLLTKNLAQLTGPNCLGAAGATLTPDGITIEIKPLQSILGALNGCLKLELESELPSIPELDVPSVDQLLGALNLQLVPKLGSDANLFGIERVLSGANKTLFTLDVLNVNNLLSTITQNTGDLLNGQPIKLRDIKFDLKVAGQTRKTFTVSVKLLPLPLPALPDLVPVVTGDLLDVLGPVTGGLLGGLTDKVGLVSPAVCAANNLPAQGVGLGNLITAILSGNLQAALNSLVSAASPASLDALVFGVKNATKTPLTAGTPFTTTLTGIGGGPLSSVLTQTQGLGPLESSTKEARPAKNIKLLNLDLSGVTGGVGALLGVTTGCLAMPGFPNDPQNVAVKVDNTDAIDEANEKNNQTTLE